MKGHLALDQVADLKWREGDGPFIHFHAQTTDRLALFASNGRVYTLAGDKLPSARGFGEPVRLFIDLDAEVDIVQLLVMRPEMKLLIASSDGQGLRHQRRSDPRRDPQGQAARQRPRRRQGRGRPADSAKAPMPSRSSARTARWWCSRSPSFPSLDADRASCSNATATAGLSDAIAFPLGEGLSWALGGESGRTRTESDLSPWRAARGAAGRMPPIGFPRSNRFD